MGKIVSINTGQSMMTADEVLESVVKDFPQKGADVLILFYDNDGDLAMRSSGDVKRKDALWMLECAKEAIVHNR